MGYVIRQQGDSAYVGGMISHASQRNKCRVTRLINVGPAALQDASAMGAISTEFGAQIHKRHREAPATAALHMHLIHSRRPVALGPALVLALVLAPAGCGEVLGAEAQPPTYTFICTAGISSDPGPSSRTPSCQTGG